MKTEEVGITQYIYLHIQRRDAERAEDAEKPK